MHKLVEGYFTLLKVLAVVCPVTMVVLVFDSVVLIGRAGLYGLAAGKGPGAAYAIGILHGELDRTLRLLGCSSLEELTPG